jgi:multiple sugar transport system permease protein
MPEFLIWLMQGESNRLGYASAMSVVLFVFVGCVGIIQIRMMRRDWE